MLNFQNVSPSSSSDNLVGLSGSEVAAIASASQSIGSDSLSPVLLLLLLLLNKIDESVPLLLSFSRLSK